MTSYPHTRHTGDTYQLTSPPIAAHGKMIISAPFKFVIIAVRGIKIVFYPVPVSVQRILMIYSNFSHFNFSEVPYSVSTVI